MKRRPNGTVLNVDLEVEGFVSQMDEKDIQVSGGVMIRAAKDIYSSNGVENLIGSRGYDRKLKKRINMRKRSLYGVATSVDEVALRKQKLESLDIISEYEPRNTYVYSTVMKLVSYTSFSSNQLIRQKIRKIVIKRRNVELNGMNLGLL